MNTAIVRVEKENGHNTEMEEENGHKKSVLPKLACDQPFKSPVLNLQRTKRCLRRAAPTQAGNRQPYKHCLKPLVFLDVILLVFLSGKVGHLFLEGKVGQPVHNLLQVTEW